jgi:hypothetical protein
LQHDMIKQPRISLVQYFLWELMSGSIDDTL